MGGEGVEIGTLKTLDGHGRIVARGAEAHIAGALHVGALDRNPLKTVLGIHSLGAGERLLVQVGNLDVAADGTEVEREHIALVGRVTAPSVVLNVPSPTRAVSWTSARSNEA